MTTALQLPLRIPTEPIPAPGLHLRDYQEEAIDALETAERRGVQRALTVLPTGVGKTVVFAHELNRRRQIYDGHGLVLVHRDELVNQAVEKLGIVNRGATVGIVKAERNEAHADLVVASIQSLVRPARLAQCLAVWNASGGVHTIVVDECHHVAADTWQAVLRGLGAFDEGGPLTLGFTATPERADHKALGNTWQEVTYKRDILEMIKAGYLSDIRGLRIQLADLDLNRVKKSHGDYQDGALSRALTDADAPRRVVEAYLKFAPERKALLFTPTVGLAQEMADAFLAAGVLARCVHGETPVDERRDLLAQFRQGRIRVLCNALLLTEGYDEPSVDCVIVARPTRSHALFVQQIGRGTRIFPGKQDLLIMDVVGATAEHQLVTIVDLVGREARPKDGESLLEAVERQEAEAARLEAIRLGRLAEEQAYQQQRAEQLERARAGEKEVQAKTLDLFGRSKFHWLTLGPDAFVLENGTESLRLARTAEGVWVLQSRKGRWPNESLEVLYSAPDLGYVQGFGEDYLREHGTELSKAEAKWRLQSPSDKQLQTLRDLRVTIPPEITKGEASDLIGKQLSAKSWAKVPVRSGG